MVATLTHVHGQQFDEGLLELLLYEDLASVSANDVTIDGIRYTHYAHYDWVTESVSIAFLVPESVSISFEEDEIISCDCIPSGTEQPINIALLGGCRSFLEREQIIRADRCPSARYSPGASLVHTIPLQPPLPLPSLQAHLNGLPVPDRGQTLDWPHPVDVDES